MAKAAAVVVPTSAPKKKGKKDKSKNMTKVKTPITKKVKSKITTTKEGKTSKSILTKSVQGSGDSLAKPAKVSGIILIQHIPHGFYEEELKGFFSQFGTVKRVMVARSKNTGKSKGYAYVEFEFAEVAKIAANAMDNYLMFERLVKCQVLPDADARKVFKYRWVNERTCPKIKNRNLSKTLQEVKKSEAKLDEIYNYRVSKLEEKNEKLAKLGISYEFTPPPKKIIIATTEDSSTPSKESVKSKTTPQKLKKKKKSLTPKKGQLGKRNAIATTQKDVPLQEEVVKEKTTPLKPKKKSLTPQKDQPGKKKVIAKKTENVKPSQKEPVKENTTPLKVNKKKKSLTPQKDQSEKKKERKELIKSMKKSPSQIKTAKKTPSPRTRPATRHSTKLMKAKMANNIS